VVGISELGGETDFIRLVGTVLDTCIESILPEQTGIGRKYKPGKILYLSTVKK
jgi:hypothetical protein